ncbi:pistil-specific extensin-like protein [Lotus japonicus]|uniref:pistil-specific extensin-like protein n=1 Tax=Lotus japonicus TaxID=34305 RepID=UPI00259109E4|nr:pistil-specific extensin-like protein [Lotus japonicus]
MDLRVYILRVSIIVLASTLFPLCDAAHHGRAIEGGHKFYRSSTMKSWRKLKSLSFFNKYTSFGYSDSDSYGSPSSLPLPTFNSLAPQPTPSSYGASSPNIPTVSNPSLPPYSLVPSPPHSQSPTKQGPSPPKSVPIPSPPQVYLPPMVYPPPPSPPGPHKKGPQSGVWCVAKPTVPDPIVQVAMDYACGSGADCKLVQPNGPCFQPNTVLAHASYAFNSYFQNTKNGGGTCDFGGTAMLVTVDPSNDKCKFMLN